MLKKKYTPPPHTAILNQCVSWVELQDDLETRWPCAAAALWSPALQKRGESWLASTYFGVEALPKNANPLRSPGIITDLQMTEISLTEESDCFGVWTLGYYALLKSPHHYHNPPELPQPGAGNPTLPSYPKNIVTFPMWDSLTFCPSNGQADPIIAS